MRFILPLCAGLTVSAFALPLAESELVARTASPCGPNYCAGTNDTHNDYFCGDMRLGPKKLPQGIPIGTLVEIYDRLGGLCPGSFLKKWYNTSANDYTYPSKSGFQLNTAGKPIKGNQTLTVGMLIDRFGPVNDSYFSPYGSPFSQRSIPPSFLDNPPDNPQYSYNYHVYEVVKEFVTSSGPIAPWFGQAGQGTQYKTYSTAETLLSECYIKEVSLPG